MNEDLKHEFNVAIARLCESFEKKGAMPGGLLLELLGMGATGLAMLGATKAEISQAVICAAEVGYAAPPPGSPGSN